ncbi:acyloxyacyl hydrolase [Maribellus luteus]|uniref:Acyloxyacyl hydrolase n=1 Tax=Maribellus luteus TaxID=2305463 RepID=A0A399SV77_9BACT|nr:acyloxyacyl hydrolase [Maribellus luteus]RIJ45935.1 acyloxyacyl hydrolase [Maribellus luteus]
MRLNLNRRIWMFTGLFLLMTGSLMGQSNKFRIIELRGHSGSHLYGGENLGEFLKDGYSSGEIRFGWQSDKESEWSAKYGQPMYGIGLYSGNIGNADIFGNPNAVFGWMTFQTSKPHRRNVFEISPAFGLTYNLQPYNEATNPLNDAIGSRFAVYFNMHAGFSCQLTRELDLIYGIDITHFSNGRTFVPNWGLNMLGLNVGFRYHYNRLQKQVDPAPYPKNVVEARRKRVSKQANEWIGQNSVSFYAAMGTVQNYAEDGVAEVNRYPAYSFVLDYEYRYNTMLSFLAGFDFFRDESLKPRYPESEDWNLLGVHGGAAFHFWRLAVLLEAGTYLGDDKGKDPLFLRPALRFDWTRHVKLQLGLKTRRGASADWIETGVVITPFHW